MSKFSEEQIKSIGKVLNDVQRPLKERFRALFTLKNIGGMLAMEIIAEAFKDDSALLKHEVAYCLGQMQNKNAVHVLMEVLEDKNQEPIVRHEAAEALGAIAAEETVLVLEKYTKDEVQEVRETCELSLERMKWLQSNENKNLIQNCFNSIDPAPPALSTNVEDLTSTLLNESKPLFERYRAMFALRNIRSAEAIKALCLGLKQGSPLYRHEIAFVLGQLQDCSSVHALIETLCDTNENEMVRHEAAEALGAIANHDCIEVLKKYLNDDKRVVKESCEIALDMSDYENSPEFQYANTLKIECD